MNSQCCDNRDTAARSATVGRAGWRDSLLALGLAPVRLHRFRNLRTRLLHEALCERDCRLLTAGHDAGPATK